MLYDNNPNEFDKLTWEIVKILDKPSYLLKEINNTICKKCSNYMSYIYSESEFKKIDSIPDYAKYNIKFAYPYNGDTKIIGMITIQDEYYYLHNLIPAMAEWMIIEDNGLGIPSIEQLLFIYKNRR